ncbi:MAG: DUF523 and DUF1722 domain-containing protein [Candidatus Bathyarchaeota archaeon]|nr:DUF523 and DUF1722 domain-containing protein [Candidatus Bathyarchaeota archaeon]
MRVFPRPVVVVSECITFAAVRYDGQIISSVVVEKLKSHVDFIPVCPEVSIGLGVPREPVRIVLVNGERRLIQPATRADLTQKMRAFSDSFLDSLKEVDGFILKHGSPSSGLRNVKVYGSIQKSAPIGKGPGFFGEAVLQKFPGLAIEDEGRLINHKIRHHFLTKLFALASFRATAKNGKISSLIRFHSENKYLLTAYSQKELRYMGKIVANQEGKPASDLFEEYKRHLTLALAKTPSTGSYANVLLKIMGYFSSGLSREEKAFFIGHVEKYRAGQLPLSALLSILKAWIIRFKQDYLSAQTLLEPYPEALTELDYTLSYNVRDYWK